MRLNFLFIASFVFILSCTDSSKSSKQDAAVEDDCVDGDVATCVCEDGSTGFSFCEDGCWSECDCDNDGDFPMYCGTCHGDWEYPAPPLDTKGNSDTSLVTVGAHRAHLADSNWHRRVECADCHMVPYGIHTPGHRDDSPAELTFSSVSVSQGADPTFDRVSGICSGNYCHGATLESEGSNNAPVWTAVGESEAVCGSCHGIPPGGSHPASGACFECHGNVIDEDMAFINPSLHINGQVDFSGGGMSCSACHGSEENPAPPSDTNGNTDPTVVTVGAHQSHLGASDWHRDVQCSDCHQVPESADDGHNDGAPAELSWGELSSSDGATPTFDGASALCTNTYCHGATLGAGGSNPDPQWNVVASGEVVCGDCHGIPPCSSHSGVGECAPCHNEVYDGTDWVNPQLHIDGIIQVDMSVACTACHGYPPSDMNQSFPGGAGAHERHVTQLSMPCFTCHGHDGTGENHAEADTVIQANVDIVFDGTFNYPGGTTVNNGGVPTFNHNGGNPTCTVGCHNPVVDDSATLTNSALWTDTVVPCSDCHEMPGLALPWNHDIAGTDDEIRANCSTCHDVSSHALGLFVFNDPDSTDIIDPTVSGAEASLLCKTCHDGGIGTYFGGLSAANMSDSWISPRAHDSNGVSCTACHGYHGGNPGDDLVAGAEESDCAGSGCHDDIVEEMGLSGEGGRHHVVDSEQSAGQLECVTCHAPHMVDDSPWQPITDPDDGSLVVASDVPGDSFTTSDGNTNVFCLDCHDGTWPGALDIAYELNTVNVFTGSLFLKSPAGTPDKNLHDSHVNVHGFACTHCHNAHANTGTTGNNRGRLLYNYIQVMTFPYMGKGTCQLAGGPTGCHH